MTTANLSLTPSWQRKSFLFWNAFGLLLFLSTVLPLTTTAWAWIDTSFFHLLNAPLRQNEPLRIFWALANHKLADWLEDLFILGFYIAAVYKAPREKRLKRSAQLFCCILWTALTIILINRVLCKDILRLRRPSPTLVLPSAVYLSDFISWIQVKAHSSKSFPGDHATTAMMFACSYAYLIRGKLAISALIYGAFLCLPRLAVGAHWLSDIVVGSGCIALISLSWLFFTPIGAKLFSLTEKFFGKIHSFSKSS